MMISQLIRLHAYAILFVLSLMACRGDIRPKPGSESVQALFDESNLVIRGEVTAVQKRGSEVREFNNHQELMDKYEAQVRLDRVYKGPVTQVIAITFFRPQGTLCMVSICENLSPGEYNFFFLSSEAGKVRLTDKFFGKFRAPRTDSRAPLAGLNGLTEDLLVGVQDPDSRVSLSCLELVGSLGHLDSDRRLIALYPAADAIRKAGILDALLRLHNYKLLEDAEAVFLEISTGALQDLQNRICNDIEEIRDQTAVAALSHLANSNNTALREAVIHALREIHTVQSVPALGRALADPVFLIRYDAVLGLATFQQKWELAPSLGEFTTHEDRYLAAWKDWWAENKASYVNIH